MKLSLAQISCTHSDVQQNLSIAKNFVQKASKNKSDIIIFPEMWYPGKPLSESLPHASKPNEGAYLFLSKMAKDYHISITGSHLALKNFQHYNTSVFYDNSGNLVAEYDKIHLFRLMNEHQYLQAGDASFVFDTSFAKCGMVICYDIRFPELMRNLALNGAKIIFVSAAWPKVRLEHWKILLQARAIENQIFIAACNRTDTLHKQKLAGHSMIIDPWGNILVEGGEEPELLSTEIDLVVIDQVRSVFDVYRDRHSSYSWVP